MTAIVDTTIPSASASVYSHRVWSERIQGAIMIGVLLVGAWQGAAALATPAAQRRLAPVLDRQSILAGRTAAAINYVEAHYLPADGLLRAAGGIYRWGLFRSGGPQVTVGCDDWLYLTEELRPWPDASAHMQARADTLARVAARLSEKNIRLVVTLVPDKARIEAGTLCGASRSTQADGRYAAFMGLLKARSVPVVDLAAPFAAARHDGPLYYRTDTHWNQTGAALAARLVAASATETPATENPPESPLPTDTASSDLPSPQGKGECGSPGTCGDDGVADRGYRYRTDRAAVPTPGPGDMLRLMSLDHVPDLMPKLRPRPDMQYLEQTVQVAAPAETGGLLDDGPGGQVVLLGSSFSLNANFQGRLQEALRVPVGNFAEAGGGFASAARTYFKGGAFADTPPRLVIWEIPERVLGQPLDSADRALDEGW